MPFSTSVQSSLPFYIPFEAWWANSSQLSCLNPANYAHMHDTHRKAHSISTQETQLLLLACTRKTILVSCHFAFCRPKSNACSTGISDLDTEGNINKFPGSKAVNFENPALVWTFTVIVHNDKNGICPQSKHKYFVWKSLALSKIFPNSAHFYRLSFSYFYWLNHQW